MRVIKIKLDGVEYPMCMSLTAVERIEEEFGGLEQMMEAVSYSDATGMSGLIHAMETALGIFLDAGRIYVQQNGGTVPPLPDCRIADLLGVDDLGSVFGDLLGAVVSASSEREVEAEPSKKGGATAEGPVAADRGFDSPQPKPD